MSHRKNIYTIFSEEEIYYLAKYVKKISSKADIISEVSNSDTSKAMKLEIEKHKIIYKIQQLRVCN